MAAMGGAGVAGSMLAAKFLVVKRSRSLLAAGFAVCAAAAGLSIVAGSVAFFFGVALLVGLGAGLTTVTLAGVLRRALGGKRLGLVIGLGTGLAYGFCNLPVVFAAGAVAQASLAMLAAGTGLIATWTLTFEAPPDVPAGGDYSRPGVALWALVFLALVGLDSAAFYVIQHTPELKAEMWNGSGKLAANAGMHLVAAVLAGWALDRRWVGRTVLAGAVALSLACLLINQRDRALAAAALLYTAGVSIYSTALVFYPVCSLRPGLAALVYAVAGWGGSALGIGLADHGHVLPVWFLTVAGTVVPAALVVRHFLCRDKPAVDR
jgi:cytochrome c oxidase cbb3-type subunit 2